MTTGHLNDLLWQFNSSKLMKLTNCYLCVNSELIFDDLWIRSGKIQDAERLFFVDKVSPEIIIDCDRAIISPGFIDVQINGGFGRDFSDASQDIEESLSVVGCNLVRYGVTGFCPTVVASPREVYDRVLSANCRVPRGCALHHGYHIEGPFLSKLKSGMHKSGLIRDDLGEDPLAILFETYGNNLRNVKYVTLAPEIPNSHQIIKYFVDQGISVALGHSAANLEQGIEAIKCGANMLTHIFCSMTSFHHRDPHLVGLLTHDADNSGPQRLFYGLITDLVHTHPTAIRIAHRANKHGLIVVTDANPALGLSDGRYFFGSYEIEVINNKACLKNSNILAGGTTPLDQCMRNYWMSTAISRAEALDAVTSHPAEFLKLDHRKGYLKAGFDADFVMLDYESMTVLNTWIDGDLVYCNPERDMRMIVI